MDAERVERRRKQRFQAKEGSMVVLAMRGREELLRVGDLIDISQGGLSYRYVPAEERAGDPPNLDIFGYSGPPIHLDGIPYQIVYDAEVPESFRFGIPKGARRCGVKFGELSDRQLSHLNAFISHYTLS